MVESARLTSRSPDDPAVAKLFDQLVPFVPDLWEPVRWYEVNECASGSLMDQVAFGVAASSQSLPQAMSQPNWTDFLQPAATTFVGLAVTALTLVEVGVIPSTRVTTAVTGGGGYGGLSDGDTIRVKVTDFPSYLNVSVNGKVETDTSVSGSISTSRY